MESIMSDHAMYVNAEIDRLMADAIRKVIDRNPSVIGGWLSYLLRRADHESITSLAVHWADYIIGEIGTAPWYGQEDYDMAVMSATRQLESILDGPLSISRYWNADLVTLAIECLRCDVGFYAAEYEPEIVSYWYGRDEDEDEDEEDDRVARRGVQGAPTAPFITVKRP